MRYIPFIALLFPLFLSGQTCDRSKASESIKKYLNSTLKKEYVNFRISEFKILTVTPYTDKFEAQMNLYTKNSEIEQHLQEQELIQKMIDNEESRYRVLLSISNPGDEVLQISLKKVEKLKDEKRYNGIIIDSLMRNRDKLSASIDNNEFDNKTVKGWAVSFQYKLIDLSDSSSKDMDSAVVLDRGYYVKK